MTGTTDLGTVGGAADSVVVTEHYWRYRFDADAASARTDTPDLMRIFRDAEAEDLAEGYRMTEDEARAIHADLGELSRRTWPE